MAALLSREEWDEIKVKMEDVARSSATPERFHTWFNLVKESGHVPVVLEEVSALSSSALVLAEQAFEDFPNGFSEKGFSVCRERFGKLTALKFRDGVAKGLSVHIDPCKDEEEPILNFHTHPGGSTFPSSQDALVGAIWPVSCIGSHRGASEGEGVAITCLTHKDGQPLKEPDPKFARSYQEKQNEAIGRRESVTTFMPGGNWAGIPVFKNESAVTRFENEIEWSLNEAYDIYRLPQDEKKLLKALGAS